MDKYFRHNFNKSTKIKKFRDYFEIKRLKVNKHI